MVQRWICTDDECLHEDDAGDMVLHTDYAQLEAESLEQARLLGMSAEREIALRAKADRMADTLKVISEGTQYGLGEGWAPTLEAITAQKALAAYQEGKPEQVVDMRSIEEIVEESFKSGKNEKISVPVRWLYTKLFKNASNKCSGCGGRGWILKKDGTGGEGCQACNGTGRQP